MEPLPVVGGQCVTICDNPSLHSLHHEMNVPFVGEIHIPAVPPAEVREVPILQWIFRIHQQQHYICVGPLRRISERIECVVARPDTSKPPPPPAALCLLFLFVKEGV